MTPPSLPPTGSSSSCASPNRFNRNLILHHANRIHSRSLQWTHTLNSLPYSTNPRNSKPRTTSLKPPQVFALTFLLMLRRLGAGSRALSASFVNFIHATTYPVWPYPVALYPSRYTFSHCFGTFQTLTIHSIFLTLSTDFLFSFFLSPPVGVYPVPPPLVNPLPPIRSGGFLTRRL